jgi:hypothetical protein
MSRSLRRLAPACLVAAALFACRVPPGSGGPCGQSLAGPWRHADDPGFRYLVEDDGTAVTAQPLKPDGGPDTRTRIRLRREKGALSGATEVTGDYQFPDAGPRECKVEFTTRAVTCEPGRLVLEVEQSGAVGPDCKRVDTGTPDIAQHVWLRE